MLAPANCGLFSTNSGVGLLPCIVQKAPVVEQVLAKADAVHLLQELLGNDGVGVDVGAVEGNDDPFVV